MVVTAEQQLALEREILPLGGERLVPREVVARDDSDPDGDAVLVSVRLEADDADDGWDREEFWRIRVAARRIADAVFGASGQVRVVYEPYRTADDAPPVADGGKH